MRMLAGQGCSFRAGIAGCEAGHRGSLAASRGVGKVGEFKYTVTAVKA